MYSEQFINYIFKYQNEEFKNEEPKEPKTWFPEYIKKVYATVPIKHSNK